MQNNTPRGIRNNNPGNIRHAGIAWQGLADPPSDGAFCVFTEPKFGIRALAMLLCNYKKKQGINTIAGIICRFAPATENDTQSYIRQVCDAMGKSANEPLDTENEATLLPLIRAIIKHENGQQPYTDGQITEGIRCLKE